MQLQNKTKKTWHAELGIPYETAIFLEVADGEFISSEYMKGFAEGLIDKGYTPAFKASTDAAFGFDREFSRITSRTIKNLADDSVISTETFTYDAAGNLTDDSNDTTFAYDTNNRLTSYNGTSVLYDMDGNMLSNGSLLCTYDSSNRLHTANGHTYTYNAEDVRIRNLCEDEDTTYTYNTNTKLR